MAFHFPTPRRRQRRPVRRVVDESGFPADRELPAELRPATGFMTRRPIPTGPAMLPSEQRRHVADVREVPVPRPPTWEERFETLWSSIDDRLAALTKFVTDKSAFDDGQMVKWSQWMRGKRVNGDRDVDAMLLESQYAEGGTAMMAGIQREIRARMLADALAASA